MHISYYIHFFNVFFIILFISKPITLSIYESHNRPVGYSKLFV